MSCGIGVGASHYAGCTCHENGWVNRLAAAEERAEKYEKALREVLVSRADLCCADDCASHKRLRRSEWCPSCIARAALLPPPEPAGGEG